MIPMDEFIKKLEGYEYKGILLCNRRYYFLFTKDDIYLWLDTTYFVSYTFKTLAPYANLIGAMIYHMFSRNFNLTRKDPSHILFIDYKAEAIILKDYLIFKLFMEDKTSQLYHDLLIPFSKPHLSFKCPDGIYEYYILYLDHVLAYYPQYKCYSCYNNDHEENNIWSLTPVSPDLIYEIEDKLGMIGENAWDHP